LGPRCALRGVSEVVRKHHQGVGNLPRIRILMSSPSYSAYIRSPAWRTKRRERLALDKGRCVVCGARAVNVHHITYERLGDENVRRDLVSVCRACHTRLDAIERAERLERRSTKGGRMGKPGVFRGWLERRALVLVALAVLLALLLAMAAVQAAQARTPGAFSGRAEVTQRVPRNWRYAVPDRRTPNGQYSPAGRMGRGR